MQAARRRAGLLAVCTLDIDHFKAINDRIGRAGGNKLLNVFTQRLEQLLQDGDVLGRTGGDEFVLLLQRDLEGDLIDELMETIRRPLCVEGRRFCITASLGVTFYPRDDVDGGLLLRHANQAMYRAKQLGRNTFCRFDPLHERELQERQARLNRFAEAIVNDELCLHYQPQIDMVNGVVMGVEALVRWQHPDEGLLLPDAFLPFLHGSLLEIDLGEWVIEQALRQLMTWQEEGIELPIHVNISPIHLLSGDFIDWLADVLARYPEVPAERLKLEVVETTAMQDIATALSAITRCQALGVHVAIDDFGTGFSSLTYLRQLPVDLIKIDRSFVRDMLVDPDDMAIVESVIYMAKRFGRPTLAEGVESLEHAHALLGLGCAQAQGNGIAVPMPAEQLSNWLVQWPTRVEWSALSP